MHHSYKKLFSFVPAVSMAILIFWFSSQGSSDSSQLSSGLSLKLFNAIINFFHITIAEADFPVIFDHFHVLIRKLAHFSEYFVLGLAVFLPYYVYSKREKKYLFYTILICLLYSCSDEVHQFFVPGRACKFVDVLIDTSGSSLGMLFVHFFLLIINKNN